MSDDGGKEEEEPILIHTHKILSIRPTLPVFNLHTSRRHSMSQYTNLIDLTTIYAGLPLFITGVIGNLLNAIVFYRSNIHNPSTFLLFLSSCTNLVYMFVGLLSRVLAVGFDLDWTITSLTWCKARYYFIQLCSLTSVSLLCYATIDQFFVTSRTEKWRRFSTLSNTRKIILALIIFWILYSIPMALFSDVIERNIGVLVCSFFTKNLIFNRFAAYFSLPLVSAIGPITVLIMFGGLTYRNVSWLRANQNRERVQRQLTSMILLHVILIIISIIPLAFFYFYLAITLNDVKDVNRGFLENLIENLVSLISYFSYSTSFFVYFFSSTTFRCQLKRLLHLRTPRVEPERKAVLSINPPRTPHDSLRFWKGTYFIWEPFVERCHWHVIRFLRRRINRRCCPKAEMTNFTHEREGEMIQ